MKVVHKGIVIIVLPLMVQIGAIVALMCILDSAHHTLDKSRRSRDVLAAMDTFRNCLARDNVQSLISRIDPTQADEEKKRALSEQVNQSIDKLDKMTRNHPAERKLVQGFRTRVRLSNHIQHLYELYPRGVSIATTVPKTGAGANFLME